MCPMLPFGKGKVSAANFVQLHKPPPSKGRWLAASEPEGLSAHTADLKILQNDSFTIPHPLTREPPFAGGSLFLSVPHDSSFGWEDT